MAAVAGWPDQGIPTCVAIENEYRGWVVHWRKGGARPGYVAQRDVGGCRHELFGETPGQLRALLFAVMVAMESKGDQRGLIKSSLDIRAG
ncbi:hypothetical protein [Actinoplanes sp. NPDC051859]|uniref:hypothetical protein n=1 Tax=Actinoplanes sp. NPDC051859 TaxID=3363909 RepID=UPI003790C222